MIFSGIPSLRSSGFAPAVCIIGSGPAGLSLALKLEQKKIPCLIVEAGGLQYNPDMQDAYKGSVVGDEYFDLAIARLRQFGGSSGHWAGWSRGLDEIDYEPRAGIEKSGWPIRQKDLDPYALETESILEIAPRPKDKPVGHNLSEIHFEFSPPVRFGEKYRTAIERSRSIGLLLESAAVDVVPARNRIQHVNVRSKDGRIHPIAAPFFAVCAGGIENSRILLWANRQHLNGTVPDSSTLGRYWMEHPISIVGDALLFSFTGLRVKTKMGMRFYAPTPQYLRSRDIGNFAMRLMVGENLAKALVRDGVCHSPQLFRDLAMKMNQGLVCSAVMQLAWEQAPNKENRIELDTAKDATGMPRAKLFWRRSPHDRRTATEAVAMVGAYLAESDLGRMKVADWLLTGNGFAPDGGGMAGFHHMGGTRMASSASDGVVDAHCKVFGVDNLYVGGSSVFPTGGHTNPTYAIVQLALRLGDHLSGLTR